MTPAWAIFISGRGSNAQALMDIIDELPLRLVVSSRDNVWGLVKAKRRGISSLVLDRKINWEGLHQELLRRRIDRIFLLGFMKIVPSDFVQLWSGRIFNLHPSLLPEFPGLHAIEQSYMAGGKMGVTVHEVTPEMDAGPRCFQKVSVESATSVDLQWAELMISRDEQRLVRHLAWGRSSAWPV